MSRDSLKSKEYFDNYISYEDHRITKFTDVLNKLPAEESEKIRQCKQYLSTFYKNKLSAMYSAGYDKSSIKSIAEQYLTYSEQSGIGAYSDMVDALSLAIVFDFSPDMLKHTLENPMFDDALVLFLKGMIKNKPVYSGEVKLIYPEQYELFLEILSDSDLSAAEEKVVRFIEHQWYPLNKDMAWFDSHKNPNDVYSGYWCWLAAAIIKIKKMDKGKFVSCKYIPLDLL
ncbi:PoNe immunity protein domain-containing protein [Lachnospiraceae bacterium 54-53]